MAQLQPLRSLQPAAQSKRSVSVKRFVCRAEMRVLAIPGALRRASTNNGLLRAAAQVVPEGMHVVYADISQLPLYNDDMWESGIPESVARFREQIQSADALLFSVPEYNYSLPGPMKNAIDWASRNPNQLPWLVSASTLRSSCMPAPALASMDQKLEETARLCFMVQMFMHAGSSCMLCTTLVFMHIDR